MKRLLATLMAVVFACAWAARAQEACPAAAAGSCCAVAAVAAEKPAACPCNAHVLAIKDNKAISCACGKECQKCTLSDDGKQCSCGKPVQTYDLTGKFVCAACKCVAPKEGKCPKCGKDLAKVEKAAATPAAAKAE